MKPTPRDLASASPILALLLASAASAQHATESLTSEGQYTVEAAADPGYYTGQYQHQQAQDFYSQYSEEPQATLAGDTDRTLDFFAGAVSAPMVMLAAFMSALVDSILEAVESSDYSS